MDVWKVVVVDNDDGGNDDDDANEEEEEEEDDDGVVVCFQTNQFSGFHKQRQSRFCVDRWSKTAFVSDQRGVTAVLLFDDTWTSTHQMTNH